jgi:putative permease
MWILAALGTLAAILLFWFWQALAPVFAGLVIAYLLDPLVLRLENLRFPRLLAIVLVMLGSVLLVALVIFALLPTVVEQLNSLANQIGPFLTKVEVWLVEMEFESALFPGASVQEFVGRVFEQLQDQVGRLITFLLQFASGTFVGTVNVIIVAFLTFFILKDKILIWEYIKRLVPVLGKPTFGRVFNDIDRQMGRFIKGKFIVVIVLFCYSTLVYLLIGLDYFLLLGIMTGLSTFIPYVGAIAVTVPVVVAALLQWGTWPQTLGALAAYTGIQIVDGNYLTPVLIGRETNIHPVAIIGAILICGSLWGFWGVFFAVPAAVVVKSVLDQVYFAAREEPIGGAPAAEGDSA